jgi:hypothetical protein
MGIAALNPSYELKATLPVRSGCALRGLHPPYQSIPRTIGGAPEP